MYLYTYIVYRYVNITNIIIIYTNNYQKNEFGINLIFPHVEIALYLSQSCKI